MRSKIRGIAVAQRLAREAIHEAAAGLRAGDREIDVARRIERRLARAGVRRWLHTAYAWWGERTRFARFVDWEPDALPSERRIVEGEPFILDVAPLVDGHPADYAFSGVLGADHRELKAALADIKARIVEWARRGDDLFRAVGEDLDRRGLDAVHPLYPAGVLGHSLNSISPLFAACPRIGDGFQLSLVGTYGIALLMHRFCGAPYPFISAQSKARPVGLYAVEPHVGRGPVGAKFESILLVDGDETRWLDPGLFGEVEG